MKQIEIKPYAFAEVKKTASICGGMTSKMEKLAEKINVLAKEYKELEADFMSAQGRVQRISGGLTTKELVLRKVGADGKPTQTYVENPEFVHFDEVKRVYVVTIPEEGDKANEPAAPAEEAVQEVEHNDAQAEAEEKAEAAAQLREEAEAEQAAEEAAQPAGPAIED